MSNTIAGVAVTRTLTPRLRQLTSEHGTTFAYERHLDDTLGVAILVACLCPGGHKVAGLPWRGWIRMDEATMTLVDVLPPEQPKPITLADIALLPTPDDLRPEDGEPSRVTPIGTRVPARASVPMRWPGHAAA